MSGTGGERKIALAAIAGAHGVRGELRLKLFSDSLEGLLRRQKFYVGGVERRLVVINHRAKMPIAKVDGVSSRAEAESLRGSLVEVPRSALPPLEHDEYYHADLIGLPALDGEGNLIGTVIAVENYGAGDLLEIEGAKAKRVLVPFRRGVADLSGDHVVVDPAFLA